MRGIRAQTGSEQSEPKTILGFLLGYFAVFAGAVVAVVAALVWNGYATMAGVVLVAAFLASLAIPIWVTRTHARNPAALTIGQSTARDYLAIERWTAGDSSAGEYVIGSERIAVVEPLALLEGTPGEMRQLEQGETVEDEEGVVGLDSGRTEDGEGTVVDMDDVEPGADPEGQRDT